MDQESKRGGLPRGSRAGTVKKAASVNAAELAALLMDPQTRAFVAAAVTDGAGEHRLCSFLMAPTPQGPKECLAGATMLLVEARELVEALLLILYEDRKKRRAMFVAMMQAADEVWERGGAYTHADFAAVRFDRPGRSG